MKLNTYEQEMLSGKHGEAKRVAMKILSRMGEIYGAEEMISVESAHIDGCSYSAVWDAGLDFAEKMEKLGGQVAVPTSLNITSRDIREWEKFQIPVGFAKKCERMENAYINMGCIPTWTCSPYQYGNVPRFGTHIAWAESNAVNYANSILGARTERYGDLIDLCCALVGRAPYMGLHKTENRAAKVVYDISQIPMKYLEDPSAFAVLGYLVGKDVKEEIPAVVGAESFVGKEHLKAFSAASAASGSVGMFHVIGCTPEARTLKEATQGKEDTRNVAVDEEMYWHAYEELTHLSEKREEAQSADLVLIGCPHLSYDQMEYLYRYLKIGKKNEQVRFLVQTSDMVYQLLSRSGLARKMEDWGIEFMRDGCILNQPMNDWKLKRVVTNSGKMAYYATGHLKASVYFRGMVDCVRSAVEGRVMGPCGK